MNHADHVRLIQGGIPNSGGVWADFGSGSGAFTLALADCLSDAGEIVSVDRDEWALRQQEREMARRFPKTAVSYHHHDYTRPLTLPPLDGIIMANTLHFIKPRQRIGVLQMLRGYLEKNGRFIIIEYDTDTSNRWVPYPMSFQTWQATAKKAGFSKTTLLTTHPTRLTGRMFSALSV